MNLWEIISEGCVVEDRPGDRVGVILDEHDDLRLVRWLAGGDEWIDHYTELSPVFTRTEVGILRTDWPRYNALHEKVLASIPDVPGACEECRHKGWFTCSNEDRGRQEIQRCDVCKVFVSDDEAHDAAASWMSDTLWL